MEHQFYIDRLSAYFDNELKNEELVIVKEHIDGCDECRKRLQELEKLENLIAENSDLSKSDYWEQSAQKIEASLDSQESTEVIKIKKATPSSSLWWKLSGVAASLVLVALFAFEQKDAGDELLLEDMSSPSIEQNIVNNAPIIEDTVLDEELSLGIVKAEEDDNQDTPLAEKQAVDNLQSKPQTAPLPVKLKKESRKSKPTHSADSDVLDETEKKDIRIIEFKNEGVTVTASNDIIERYQTKNLDQSIEVQAEAAVDEKDESISIFEISEDTNLKSKSNSIQSLSGASTKSLPVESVDFKKFMPKNNYEIEYWRRRVDQNSELLKYQSKKSVRYFKSATDDTSKKKAAVKHSDTDLLYKQIFEAYYNIAIMTSDSTEEKQAVQFLTKHADSVGKSYNADALYYLELYKIEKNRQNSKKE